MQTLSQRRSRKRGSSPSASGGESEDLVREQMGAIDLIDKKADEKASDSVEDAGITSTPPHSLRETGGSAEQASGYAA